MRTAVIVLALTASTFACEKWPNGTDTTFKWWQCSSGPVKFYNASPYDGTGSNYEYPIHLGRLLMVKTEILNPLHVYTAGNLRQTINLWSWGGWGGCKWSVLPTLGLLKNLDACSNGVPCPIGTGRQDLNILIDFSKYQTIIDMLKDDSPYQLEYMLHDRKTGDNACMMVQARARIH